MSERRDAELVADILEASRRIELYTKGLDYEAFRRDLRTQDAVVRNLEIIGEAVKGLTLEFRSESADVPWQDVARLRDRLIHHYFGINWEIVWNVVEVKLPELRRALLREKDG